MYIAIGTGQAVPLTDQRPVPVKKTPVEPQAATQGRRVADIYTERVTLQLSPEMRDNVWTEPPK